MAEMHVKCDRPGCSLCAVYHVLDKGANWCIMHLPDEDKVRELDGGETATVYSFAGFTYV